MRAFGCVTVANESTTWTLINALRQLSDLAEAVNLLEWKELISLPDV